MTDTPTLPTKYDQIESYLTMLKYVLSDEYVNQACTNQKDLAQLTQDAALQCFLLGPNFVPEVSSTIIRNELQSLVTYNKFTWESPGSFVKNETPSTVNTCPPENSIENGI